MKLVESLSVRDRLLRRKEYNTVTVALKDDLGDINIELRLLSPEEQTELIELYSDLVAYQLEAKNIPKGDAAKKEMMKKGDSLVGCLYGWVGKICVDPELNEEYWKKGSGFTIDVPLALLKTVMSESQKVAEDLHSFRTNKPR